MGAWGVEMQENDGAGDAVDTYGPRLAKLSTDPKSLRAFFAKVDRSDGTDVLHSHVAVFAVGLDC